MGEHSFSKSWGLRASVSFSPLPLPLPCHSFFLLLSSQCSWRTRAETLATQASQVTISGISIHTHNMTQFFLFVTNSATVFRSLPLKCVFNKFDSSVLGSGMFFYFFLCFLKTFCDGCAVALLHSRQMAFSAWEVMIFNNNTWNNNTCK